MRSALLGIVTSAACYVSAPSPPREPLQVGHTSSPPTPPATAIATSSSFFVGGCNTACKGCALHGNAYVIGTLASTGAHLFPAPFPPGPPGNAYSCSASVAIGETVTLRAHTTEGVELETWQAFNASDYCPCAGTRATMCHVTITPEVAASHPRAYCGAVWRPRSARIAR